MAKLFTAREIAVLALRKCGVVAPQDTSAPEAKVLTALQYLDMLLAEVVGTTRVWNFVPNDLVFTYPANESSADITALLGGTAQIDIFREAYVDSTDAPIRLLLRDEWDLFQHGSSPFPEARMLFITPDGDGSHTAYLRSVPTTDLDIRLTGMRFSPTVTNASQGNQSVAHSFDAAWQRWMVNKLSADIGDGPCARVDQFRLKEWRDQAAESFDVLNANRGQGNVKKARFVRPYQG